MTENIERVFNDYWKEKIVEGCKRGKVGKAKSGQWVGQAIPPYGYLREGKKRDTKLVIEEFEAGVVRDIFTWYVVGNGNGKPMTAYAICDKLAELSLPPPGEPRGPGKCWYPMTVGNLLKNRAYIGEWHYGSMGEVVKVSIPPILEDATLYKAAQEPLEMNKRMSPRRTKRDYLMRGRMTCVCGRTLVGVAVGGQSYPNYRLYRCSSVGTWQAEQCHAGSVRADYIEQEAWEWIKIMLSNSQVRRQGFIEMQHETEKQAKPMRQRLETIDRLLEECQADASELADELLQIRKSGGGELLRRAVEEKAEKIYQRETALQAERKKVAETISNMVITDEEIEKADTIFESITAEYYQDYDPG